MLFLTFIKIKYLYTIVKISYVYENNNITAINLINKLMSNRKQLYKTYNEGYILKESVELTFWGVADALVKIPLKKL
jgi:hypothetical protein